MAAITHAGDGGHRVEGPDEAAAHGAGLVGAAELGDVGARGEDPVTAGDHHRARRVVGEAAAAASSCGQQRARQGVDLGVVEADHRDPVAASLDVHERRHLRTWAATLRVRRAAGPRPSTGRVAGAATAVGQLRRPGGWCVIGRARSSSSAATRRVTSSAARRWRRSASAARGHQVGAVVARPRRHTPSTPSPEVAVAHSTGGRQRSGSREAGSAMSSMRSRSRAVSWAPGRSALLTTKTSAISISPALLAWTASPHPGLTTTSVVSAWPTTSTSTWPTPTVSRTTQG